MPRHYSAAHRGMGEGLYTTTRAFARKEEKKLAKRGKKVPGKLAKRAKQIQVLLMDVDGTLTDGSVTLLSQSDGSALEIKTFDAHAGQRLPLAVTSALPTPVIPSPA